jgi:hypothetical protein
MSGNYHLPDIKKAMALPGWKFEDDSLRRIL